MSPIKIVEGAYKGWMQWPERNDGRFAEAAIGPFYFRDAPDGKGVRCVIETGIQHTNGADFLHGGFIMSYADMVYFAIAWRSLEDVMSVTLTSTFEFVGAGRAGIPLDAVGDVVKETGKLIFVRALITQNEEPVCMTTATLRKISPRPRKRADA